MLFYYCGDRVNKKDMMYKFIKSIEKENLLTKFLINVFEYDELRDYNYIFRMIDKDNQIVIDIYDNVSLNKYNRYIYDFGIDNYHILDFEEGDVFVKRINILNAVDLDINHLKFAYLFNIDDEFFECYASDFLDSELVKILNDIRK
jgi:hypothetical protein